MTAAQFLSLNISNSSPVYGEKVYCQYIQSSVSVINRFRLTWKCPIVYQIQLFDELIIQHNCLFVTKWNTTPITSVIDTAANLI